VKTAAYASSTRRAILRLLSDGQPYRKIKDRHKVSVSTIQRWATESGIKSGSKLSEVGFNEKMEAWANSIRDLPLREGETRLDKDLRNRKKFGPSAEEKKKSLLSFSELADPDEYEKAIEQHVGSLKGQLAKATSPEEQVKLLTSGVMLMQLRTLIDEPPPLASWNDIKTCVGLLRQSLGMDSEKAGAEAADLRVLNGKVPTKKKKVQEAEVISSS
jgi:hypothetical protein|tara:strand:+ start:3213 stop:3860 length:648 start_codon:yes stop_codon:yes gene_type:complete